MDPNDLYSVRQQFTLGAYKTLTSFPLPDANAEDRTLLVLYHIRSWIALEQLDKALGLVSELGDSGIVSRAVRALVSYLKNPGEKETHLEELRDLCVEIEGEDVEGDEYERGAVRVLAGTAFAREGEMEEALETLGAGTNHTNLEQTALIVHIYLGMSRSDLARKEFDRAHKSTWATDDLLLQHIEAVIGLVTGKDSYSNPYSYFNEQLQNPSLANSNGQSLLSRGVTNLLRGQHTSAISDFEEANKTEIKVDGLIGAMVANNLVKEKRPEAKILWERVRSEYPSHPLVDDMNARSLEFDNALAQFTVPPPAVVN